MRALILHTFILFSACLMSYAQSGFEKDMAIADAAYQLREWPQAMFYYERAQSRRSSVEVSEKLGMVYMHMNMFNEASELYTRLMRITKNRAYLSPYAESLFRLGAYDKAKSRYADFLNHFPENSMVQDKLMACDSAIQWKKMKTNYRINNLSQINTTYSEIAPVVTDSLIVFCSSREGVFIKPKFAKTDQPYYDLFAAENLGDGRVSKPKPFSIAINTSKHEGPSSFSADGKTIYYTSSTVSRSKSTETFRNPLKMYKSSKELIGWSNPFTFLYDDTLHSYAHPCISSNGKLFFFSSDMDGGFGGSDIYICFKIDSSWSQPVNAGPNINSRGDELYPFYHESGKLYFASNGHLGLGGYDLFQSELKNADWSVARNMGFPINSSYDDLSIWWSSNQMQGYFASNRPGGKGSEDIYEVRVHH